MELLNATIIPLLLTALLGMPVNTQDCRQLQEQDMDTEESPCENFYQHACGNWYANVFQRNLGAHDKHSQWKANLKLKLIRYFEKGDAMEGSRPHLGNYYRSCLAAGQTLSSYTEAMARSGANFPLLERNSSASEMGNGYSSSSRSASDYSSSSRSSTSAFSSSSSTSSSSPSFDWVLANAALRQHGAQGLWRLLVQDNWQSAEQRIFYLLPPRFDLLGEDTMSEFLYQRYLKILLIEMGLRVRRAALLAERLIEFEQSLRHLLPKDVEQTLVLREPQVLREWDQQVPQLQLKRYFGILLQGLDWDESSLLIVADKEYLIGLQRILNSNRIDPLILSTWLLLQLPAHFELRMHDDENLSSQRDHCIQQLRRLMPGALGRLQMELVLGENYREEYDTAVQRITLMFRDLKQQFELALNATEVFEQDQKTRQLAREKLRAMRLVTPRLQEGGGGGGLPTNTTTWDETLMQLSLNQARIEFRQVFGEPVVAAPADPLAVNAYYRLKLNRIELPLGLMVSTLLQQQECSQDLEHFQARFSAGLGYIMAHEMVHAFDYDGINYDAGGQLANGQWPARAIIRFGLRAICYLGNRYSNATLTVNENIADSEGLRLALDTHLAKRGSKEKEEEAGQQENLRSFFVAFAQNWCGVAATGTKGGTTPQQQQQQQHAGHAERVNNVLGNLPEFVEAFQCKAGSRMNPADKCRIW
ncbi:endothelin-converting enzyme 2 [Drosophila kikkawai]|uniref:Endothelin-converting enzyme 2 n=1 Tax=Drosophila kikkawai TaxID=30033 RepID=A0A6P4J5Z7_DROKI|nr:neprilysin-1 [Drosophila kikkawai]